MSSKEERQNLEAKIANLKGAALVSEEALETLRSEQSSFKAELNRSQRIGCRQSWQSAANRNKEIAIKEAEQAAAKREREILNSTSVKIQGAQKEAKAAQTKANEANARVEAAQANATQNGSTPCRNERESDCRGRESCNSKGNSMKDLPPMKLTN